MFVGSENVTEKIVSLTAAIETLSIKISSLATFYNYLQVRAWRKHRANLNTQLRYYKAKQKSYENQNHRESYNQFNTG